MKYAVIQLAGKQYKVAAGDKITVNRLDEEAGKEFTTSDVLLTADGTKVQIGAPLVKGAAVTLKVVEHDRSSKLRVATYHAKSRYRRVHGHRQHETTLEVVAIA